MEKSITVTDIPGISSARLKYKRFYNYVLSPILIICILSYVIYIYMVGNRVIQKAVISDLMQEKESDKLSELELELGTTEQMSMERNYPNYYDGNTTDTFDLSVLSERISKVETGVTGLKNDATEQRVMIEEIANTLKKLE